MADAIVMELDIGGNSSQAVGSIDQLVSALNKLESASSQNTAALAGLTGKLDSVHPAAVQGAGSSNALASAFGQVASAAGPAGSQIGSLTSSVGSLGTGAMGGVAALGGLAAAIIGMGMAAGSGASALVHQADSMGFSVQETYKWDAMLKLAGGSSSTLTQMILHLDKALSDLAESEKKNDIGSLTAGQAAYNKTLHEAQGVMDATVGSSHSMNSALESTAGSGSAADKALKSLGIAATDANGHLRDTADVNEEIMMKLAAMGDKTQRAALGVEIYGRGFKEVNGILVDFDKKQLDAGQRVAAMKDYLDSARENADKYRQSTMDLDQSWDKFATKAIPVAMSALEGLGKTIDVVSEAVDKIRDIGDVIGLWEALGEAFKGVALTGEGVAKVIDKIGDMIHSLPEPPDWLMSAIKGGGAGLAFANPIGMAAGIGMGVAHLFGAEGMWEVPGPRGAGDVMPAMLSPGEMVLPASFAEGVRSSNGAGGGGGGNTYNISVNAGMGATGRDIADAVRGAITQLQRQGRI